MPSTEIRPNGIPNLRFQPWSEILAVTHFQKQKNALILVVRASLTNTECVVEDRRELLEDCVYFS
jgi:hypothetical protein